ncbi:MAG: flagellar biosynthetic protein FliR [Pseudomonadota bacterium]
MDGLIPYVWAGTLLFARISAVLMLAPGWGESSVPTQFRLAAALLATAALAPGVIDQLPPPQDNVGDAVVLIIGETLVGLVLGAGARLLMSALQVAGQVIGMQSGLGFAQQMDPTVGQSGALVGVLLSLMGLVMVMAAGIHRLMLQAAVDSYQVFPTGTSLPLGDVAQWGLSSVTQAFALGLQIAAPLVVFALIFNLALGLVNRLIPQVQIFFIALPSSILMGLSILALGMGGGLLAWLEALEAYARLQGPV